MSLRRFNHTATLLRDGSVLVAGGEEQPSLLALSEIYDPTANVFRRTGNLNQARKDHTATALNNGKVLIVGGDNGVSVTTSAELFDPASGRFASLAGLVVPRTFHTATMLANGSVLIAGGSARIDQNGVPISPLDTVEIFNPSTRKFFIGFFTLEKARAQHTATALDHGRKVLITGGINLAGGVEFSAELYDTRSGLFVFTGSMTSPRYGHTATLLRNGTILIAGGFSQLDGTPLQSAEIYDPLTGAFSSTGQMTHPRALHTATLLANGKVLISGGSETSEAAFDSSAEIYDPGTGSFMPTGKPMSDEHVFHTATLLRNDEVLIDGGTECCASSPPISNPLAGIQAELFHPQAAGSFTSVPSGTLRKRAFHTATLLHDGRVLIAGGEDTSATIWGTAERYDTRTRAFSPAGEMNERRAGHTANLINCSAAGCPDGQVLIAGGIGVSNGSEVDLSSAELYGSTTQTFAETASMTTPRDSASATALSDGRILIAGGEQVDGNGNLIAVLDSAEIYDPATQTFSCVGGTNGPACASSMTSPRFLQSATLLPDGTVLIAGGLDQSLKILDSAELFDPNAPNPNGGMGAFTSTGPAMNQLRMNTARAAQTATYLDSTVVTGSPGGKVLIAGGSFDLSAELYDPASGTFSCVGGSNGSSCNPVMGDVRFLHTATLLSDGTVLLAGGSLLTAVGQLFAESSAEIFDSSSGTTGSFLSAGTMTTARALHTATLLDPKLVAGQLGGDVLITGGQQENETLTSAELFTPRRRR